MAQVLLSVTVALPMLLKHQTVHVPVMKDGRFQTVHYGQELARRETCVNPVPLERAYVTLALPMLSLSRPTDGQVTPASALQTGRVIYVRTTWVYVQPNARLALVSQTQSAFSVMITPTGPSSVPVNAMPSGRVPLATSTLELAM